MLRLNPVMSPVKVFCRYILRWMVNAGIPAFMDSTLAALPVGASSTTLWCKRAKVLTIAAESDVFPVPAEPHITIAGRSSRQVMNLQNVRIASCCSSVGQKPKVSVMALLNSSSIMVIFS